MLAVVFSCATRFALRWAHQAHSTTVWVLTEKLTYRFFYMASNVARHASQRQLSWRHSHDDCTEFELVVWVCQVAPRQTDSRFVLHVPKFKVQTGPQKSIFLGPFREKILFTVELVCLVIEKYKDYVCHMTAHVLVITAVSLVEILMDLSRSKWVYLEL